MRDVNLFGINGNQSESFECDALHNAVYISLFTNRRSEDSESNDTLGGWWADSLESDPLGSKLWLLKHSKLTTETLELAKIYAQESLGWMLSQKLVSKLSINASFSGSTLELSIEMTLSDSSRREFKFDLDDDIRFSK